jgi:hypothetical protein
MIRQSGEAEEHQKSRKRRAETGFEEWNLTPDVVMDDEIDPADYFDPEEFGIRRRDLKSINP